MKRKSIRTTLWGTLAGLAGAYASFTPDPTHKAAAGGVAAFFTALLGLSARDHSVTSHDAGLDDPPPTDWIKVPITNLPEQPEPKAPSRPTSGPLLCLIALLGLLGPLFFTGCAGTLQNPRSFENKAKAIAWTATTKLLQDRPDWRPAFELARDDLALLVEADNIGFAEVFAILDRFPTGQLTTGDAALYFGGAMMFFEDELGTIVVEQPEQLRSAVRGLLAGLRRALGNGRVTP
jgi:hypothetical protein